jgi:hypothetical protein
MLSEGDTVSPVRLGLRARRDKIEVRATELPRRHAVVVMLAALQ